MLIEEDMKEELILMSKVEGKTLKAYLDASMYRSIIIALVIIRPHPDGLFVYDCGIRDISIIENLNLNTLKIWTMTKKWGLEWAN